jgi:6-phosphofructokinase 1
VQHIVDVVEGAILKRRVMGRPDGVAILAEGLAYRLGDREELERLLGRPVPVDAAGHPRLSEFPLAEWVRSELRARFTARGESFPLVNQELGYELRSSDPTPFDIELCRSLGYFSVELLLDESRARPACAMATFVNGNLLPMDLHEFIDPQTNRTRIRPVDVRSDRYRVARAYMIRLEPPDFENESMLTRLAGEAHLTPQEFRQRYAAAASRPA